MRAIVDTNVLLRFLCKSAADQAQNEAAARVFNDADEIIIPTHVLCELVWVLSSLYKLSREKIQSVVQMLLNSDAKLTVYEDEVEAGLKMLQAGGDFADGVNAYTGKTMTRGDTVFVSFDKKAVRLLGEQGVKAMLPV
jgi:predicted nucleic-acid-binding protein